MSPEDGMSRRAFIGASAMAAASLQAGRPEAQARRPNIVFIMADDLGREWLSCCGSEGHETPNIDALAAGGVQFDTCYATPLCTPTRTQLLTGRYGFRVQWSLDGNDVTGGPEERLEEPGWINHWDVPRWGGKYFDWEKEITFARVLRDAGYATAIAGKWQINDLRDHPDALARHGFDEHCAWTGYETGNPPSGERYWDPFLQWNGERKTHAGAFGPDLFCDFTVDFIRRNREQPFLAYVPMALTHTPFVKTPLNRDTLEVDPKTPEAKRALFAGMVDYTDHVVGRIIDGLDELGLREDTIVIFTTDNGSPGVSCRAWGRDVRGGKSRITESGIHVPLIANCPGRIPAGLTTDALVDFSDILPTFAEVAQADLPSVHIDGQSFAPALYGQAFEERQWIHSQLGGKRAVRDRRFKLRENGKLFDLRSDPFEETDLSASDAPEAVEAKARLGAVMADLHA